MGWTRIHRCCITYIRISTYIPVDVYKREIYVYSEKGERERAKVSDANTFLGHHTVKKQKRNGKASVIHQNIIRGNAASSKEKGYFKYKYMYIIYVW